MRPPLFIRSSKESLTLAYALQQNLEDCAEVTVWTQGVFELTSTALQSLLKALDRFEFAVLVFSDDDVTQVRGQQVSTVRDNVIFESGLFLGRIGPERSFIVVPRGVEDLHLPSDLAGIIPAEYDSKRQDGNLLAALGPASLRICAAIQNLSTPFDDELYDWFEDLAERLRRLVIRKIVSSNRSSEFPTDGELSKLPMSELTSIYRLLGISAISPEALDILFLQYDRAQSTLRDGGGMFWESTLLRQDLEEFEADMAIREQTGQVGPRHIVGNDI